MRIVNFIITLLVVVSCTPKKPIHTCKSESDIQHNNLLTLLSIDCAEKDTQYNYSFELDTINNKIIATLKSQENGVFHQRVFHLKSNSIVFEDKINGRVELVIRNGLIYNRNTSDNRKLFIYDSLKHLRSVKSLNGDDVAQERLFYWKGDNLVQVIDSFPNLPLSVNTKYQITSSSKKTEQFEMPELLVKMLGYSMDEIVFAQLGLYGKLPLAKDFTIDKLYQRNTPYEIHTVDYYKTIFSGDGSLKKSTITENHYKEEKMYIWNKHNIDILSNSILKIELVLSN